MRRATCPVLAVDSNRRTIPRRALLAIDFSPSSIAAAREALRLIGQTGPVYLVHVTPRSHVPFTAEAPAAYEPDIDRALDELRTILKITGSRGSRPFRGPVVGAVPTVLVRAARCSVLIVPPSTE